MFAQLVTFDGPRSPELAAAADRASQERIMPLISSDPQIRAAHRGTFVLRRADGGQVVLVLSDTVEALERGNELINGSCLLPGEDPALLREPDHVEVYEVVYAADADYQELGARP
jgi:hypothetical protein